MDAQTRLAVGDRPSDHHMRIYPHRQARSISGFSSFDVGLVLVRSDPWFPAPLPLSGDSERQAGWRQGLTLVHFLAQLKRIMWDRGCI